MYFWVSVFSSVVYAGKLCTRYDRIDSLYESLRRSQVAGWDDAVTLASQSEWVPSVCYEDQTQERISSDDVYSEPLASDITFISGSSTVRSIESVIQNGAENSKNEFVLKYSHTCGVHPLGLSFVPGMMNEYLVMRVIQHLDISARAIAISVPVYPMEVELWTDSSRLRSKRVLRMIDKGKSFSPCLNRNAVVQAMITQRVGPDVKWFYEHSVFGSSVLSPFEKLRVGITLGLRSIELIERLHSMGFLHNDIHNHNLLMRETRVRQNNPTDLTFLTPPSPIVLIDFELASYFPSEIGSAGSRPSGLPKSHLSLYLLSPWQLEGKRTGRRDDLYRLMELLVDLIGRARFMVTGEREELIPIYLRWKRETNFFVDKVLIQKSGDNSSVCDVHRLSSEPSCTAAMIAVQKALDYIRSLNHPDDTPDYTIIKSHLSEAIALLGPRE
jgi:serine/threonine protein kinase